MIWQIPIIARRLMLSQREGGLKEGLDAFIRVLLGCFSAFPVPLYMILCLKSLNVTVSCRFMPTSPHAGNFQVSGSGLDISATITVWRSLWAACAYDCGPEMPQMKQARDRFQNTVPALETFATEFYGCQKFVWAQKITALNSEMSY